MSRVVLVTGASSGLGLSLTENFRAQGDTVYGITKTKRHWVEAKKRLQRFKALRLIQADLSREEAVKKLFGRIRKEKGRIDILINNAGYANRPSPFEKEPLKELNQNLSGNLISVFLMCKHALPFFKKQRAGWIINVSSMAGKRAVPLLATYSASKFGVLALTQSLAKEHAEGGFQCITVCPGGMNTRMRAKLFGKDEAARQQSPDFVAGKIMEIIDGKIEVPSGGDIIIRHNQVAAVNAAPEA
jgi:NAD(P)-dependent dehydrogenase (short-subunit alcohol dehydrogenase family)